MDYSSNRLIRPILARLSLIVGRAVVKYLSSTSGEHQRLRVIALNGETISDIDWVQAYGLESVPLAGAEAIGVFPGGNRDNGVIVIVGDRRYRPQDIVSGEVAVYTDEDELSGGHRVHLKRGQILHLIGKLLTGIFTSSVTITVPTFTINGDLTVSGDVSDSSGTAQTMAAMRAAYNPHTHPGGAGSPPNPLM